MDTVSDSESSTRKSKYPSPSDFNEFVPWACTQMQAATTIIISRGEQGVYSSPNSTDRKARRPGKPKDEAPEATSGEKISKPSIVLGLNKKDSIVYIQTIYDPTGYLIKLNFHKNIKIPRKIFQIITLTIPFHPRITTISIDSGLKYDGLYELSTIISISKITEIILDNTAVSEANYYMLLDKKSSLKYLSLARCMINDETVEAIARRLSTSSLSILNLSSNRITDVGAACLGDVLRSNRKLTYLNLADNMLTDTGAASILNCLMEFPLHHDEITEKKCRHIAYLRKKNELVTNFFNQMRTADLMDKKYASKKKGLKLTPQHQPKKGKALDKESSLRTLLASSPNFETVFFEKAELKAIDILGLFHDAFSSENTIKKNGVLYCLGNNALSYINLAYNNLTYFSVKKVLDVLSAQEDLKRVPKGLVNVCIEGNNIPETCAELTEIDYILQTALATTYKTSATLKKRGTKLGIK